MYAGAGWRASLAGAACLILCFTAADATIARADSRHAAFVIDANTGRVLHSADADEPRALARLSDDYPDCDLVLVCLDAAVAPDPALAALVAGYSAQLKKKRRFMLVCADPQFLELLRSYRLDRIITVVPDETAALAILAGQKPD